MWLLRLLHSRGGREGADGGRFGNRLQRSGIRGLASRGFCPGPMSLTDAMPELPCQRARPEAARRLVLACGLLVVIPILFHCFFFEAGVGGADGWSYFANLESLVLDRDLDLTNNRIQFPESHPARPYIWCAETQRWVTHEPLGPAFFDAPFYVLGRWATRVWRPKISLSRPPYSTLDSRTIMLVLFVSLAHNVYAAAAMVLVYLALFEMGARPLAAMGTALLVFFGGPLHFYACNGMSHAPATLAMAAFFYVAARVIRHRSDCARWKLYVLGCAIGLTSIMRYVCGVIALPVGACIFLFSLRDECRARQSPGVVRRSWLRWIGSAFLDQFVLALGCWSVAWITLAYWRVQFGHFTGNPHANTHEFALTFWPPPLVKILFSARHGFFAFSPMFLLAMVGFGELLALRKRSERSHVRLAVAALASFAAIAFVYDSYDEWAGDGTYSTRFLTECVVLMSFGLWHFLEKGRWIKWPWLRWVTAGLLCAFSYSLFLLTRARLIYQEDAYDVGRSLWAYLYVFKEGTRLGQIASRIWASSFTSAFLAKRPVLMAAVGAGWLLLAVAVFIAWPRKATSS